MGDQTELEDVGEYVAMERSGDVVTITLDRPEKRNALALDVMREVTEAFRTAGTSDARVIVLAAVGPVFSAGHHLGEMAGASLTEVRSLFEVCTEMMDTVQEVPQPVIARVHALAAAAGCQLVATCDLAVAAESSGFALSGIHYGLFCHTPLVAVARNIGRKRALEMALSGDVVDARTAAEWGLVNRVVPDTELDDAVAELALRVSRDSALSTSLGKRGFYAQVDLEQGKAYAYAIEMIASNAMVDDAQEGFAAFLEKRKPKFTQQP